MTSLQRVDQQARVDELVGKERVVFVVEHGAQLDGAGGGVDLVVEWWRACPGDHSCWGAVVGLARRAVLPCGAASSTCGQAVFGDGEDDGDGLDLRDDRERGAARGG